MAAPAPENHARLRIGGIGGVVRLSLDGAGAADLLDRLTQAWSRCLLPVPDEAAPDAASPLASGPSSTPEPDPGPPEGSAATRGDLRVTLDPAASASAGVDRVSGTDLDTVLVQTTQAITRALIGSQAGRLLMLHAGAVAHPETGRTVVFVAPGGTGKTTLVRTLADRYGYLSDETVAIDADYRVLPYPKPLSVRRAGAPKQELSPDDLGLVAAPAEPAVVRLCLLDRDDAHPVPEVTPLDLLDAITELTPQTSSLYALPDGLRALARLIEATGPVLRLRYTEADDLLPLIDSLLTGDDLTPPAGNRPTTDSEGVPAPAIPEAARTIAPGAGYPDPRGVSTSGAGREEHIAGLEGSPAADSALRVHANPFADLLERDGEALVLLREGDLLRLNPLGASIVEFAINPIRLDALAAALERRFGTPAGLDLLEATAQRVHELAAQGVLTLGGPPLPDSPGPYWRISDDAAFTVSAPDRVVVFNLATPTEQPQALVGTAAAIWQFLIGDDSVPRPWTSEPDLIADLAEAYATDPAAIAPDVRSFLTRLHTTGHLESLPVGT